MSWPEELELGDAERIAVQYMAKSLRPQFATFFALDHRLGQLVAQTSEGVLGQMKLAWWRDMLGRAPEDRPFGDAVLDAVGLHWAGNEAPLIKLADGWEHMLVEPPLKDVDACSFVEGRVSALRALTNNDAACTILAKRWACADAAAHTAHEAERSMFVELGLEEGERNLRLAKELRGLAVLNSLSLRALKRGGRPIMEGRGAAITALITGIIGR